jgi:hypothetical protein
MNRLNEQELRWLRAAQGCKRQDVPAAFCTAAEFQALLTELNAWRDGDSEEVASLRGALKEATRINEELSSELQDVKTIIDGQQGPIDPGPADINATVAPSVAVQAQEPAAQPAPSSIDAIAAAIAGKD